MKIMYNFEGNSAYGMPGLESDLIQYLEKAPLNASGKVKKLLFIGEHAKFFSDHMEDLDYACHAFTISSKANLWLNRMALVPWELPDAIICDLKLLDGDAYSLFANLQGHKLLKKIPFIIISKDHSNLDKMKALETGVDDFYSLPFNARDLHHRITFLKQLKNDNSNLEKVKEKPFENRLSRKKRIFDVSLAIMAIILLSPLLLVVALLIKLESNGPIFYISKRVGTGYQIFNFYKFRSMYQDADARLKSLKHLNQYKDKNRRLFFSDITFVKIDNDPRITPLGNFLRKFCIDELPQLINVLIGDMSIVGNRPLPLYEAEQLTKDGWAKRFLAPAGITGLWQVTKRIKKDMSAEERINLDIAYSNNRSLWFDIKIILKTFPVLFQKESV